MIRKRNSATPAQREAWPERRQGRWFRGGMVAFVVLLAAIATGTVARGHIGQIMPIVAAIASVMGIGAIFRWAVLREKQSRPLDAMTSDGRERSGSGRACSARASGRLRAFSEERNSVVDNTRGHA